MSVATKHMLIRQEANRCVCLFALKDIDPLINIFQTCLDTKQPLFVSPFDTFTVQIRKYIFCLQVRNIIYVYYIYHLLIMS